MPLRPRQRESRARGVTNPLGNLTPATLRAHIPEQIHKRGVQYADDGAVVVIAWRGPVLHATVEGSEARPYRVAVRRVVRGRATGDLAAICTCPYMAESGEWCKHVIATLLVALRDPAAVPHERTVPQLLAPLDRLALARLLDRLVAREPALYDALAEEIARSAARTRRDGGP